MQQPSRARQGGREELLAHAGMNEGQHASPMEGCRDWNMSCAAPTEPTSGREGGCHLAWLEFEWFEELL